MSLAHSQHLTAEGVDGSISGLQNGTTYHCAATLLEKLHIYPDTNGEEGTPLILSIRGIPSSRVTIRFTLPSLLAGDGGGALHCQWDSTGLLWEEAERFFDPRVPLTVDIGVDSLAFVDLGIILQISINTPSGLYSNSVVCSAIDSTTGDSVTITAGYTAEVQDRPTAAVYVSDGSIQNLSKSFTYRLDPQHGTVLPTVNGNESGTPIVIHLVIDTPAAVRTSFLLPTVLKGPSGQTIPCSFDSASLYWGEDSLKLDPDWINRRCLPVDSAGSLTLKLGITVDIPPGVPSGEYTGLIGASMEYCGFDGKRGRTSLRVLEGASYTVRVVGANSLLDAVAAPREYGLEQNYPNPFNPSTTIRFSIPYQSLVTLKIFDVLGREISTLLSGIKPAGDYTIPWDARGMPAGVYFCRIVAGNWTGTRKLVSIR